MILHVVHECVGVYLSAVSFLVAFSVPDCVLGRGSHQLDGNHLKLTWYFECLGPTGGSNDPDEFPPPPDLFMKKLDRHVVLYLKQCKTFWADFKWLLEEHAHPTFVGKTLQIKCKLTKDIQGARQLAQKWSARIQEVITECLSSLRIERMPVPEEHWPDIRKAVEEKKIAHEYVIRRYDTKTHAIKFIGRDTLVPGLMEQVRNVADEVIRSNEQKKLLDTKVIKLRAYQQAILTAASFYAHQPKGVEIRISGKSDDTVSFHGDWRLVKSVCDSLRSFLENMQSETISGISLARKALLQRTQTGRLLKQTFIKNKIYAVWDVCDQKEIVVHALNKTHAQRAVATIRMSVADDTVPIPCQESCKLIQSPEWETFRNKLCARFDGSLAVHVDHTARKVVVTRVCSVVPDQTQEITGFLEQNTVFSEWLCFSRDFFRFLKLFWSEKLSEISEARAEKKVNITVQKSKNEFLIQGNRQGLAEATQEVKKLKQQVVVHTETVTSRTVMKYCAHPDSSKGLEQIGTNNRCIVTVQSASSPQVVQVITNFC